MDRLRHHLGRLGVIQRVTLIVGLLLACWPEPGRAMQRVASTEPFFQVTAPRRVRVGEPIRISLALQGVGDIAGYESLLLFDTSVVEFDGLYQRTNAIKKLGRDVGPLEAVELPAGIAFGMYSCPVDDCVTRRGARKERGGQGALKLGSLTLIARQPGTVELRLAATKFVDALGQPLTVRIPQTLLQVQVAPAKADVVYAAPDAPWALPTTTKLNKAADVTGDGLVTHADTMELALAWRRVREANAPCGAGITLRLDINGDGCIDIGDVQLVARKYSPASATSDATGQAPSLTADLGATFTVNSQADTVDANIGDGICATVTGDCTLRAAIAEANRLTEPNQIAFNIPGGGVRTITLGSSLPTLNDATGATSIDGYTQPGAAPNTDPLISNARIMIQIAGANANFDALMITSNSNSVRGLSIYQVRRGVMLSGSGAYNNLIVGNFIGTNVAGTFVAPVLVSGASGVEINTGAHHNRVGGVDVGDRNILSGNGFAGVATYHETTDANVVINNLIGLGPNGVTRLPNRRHGIDINVASSNNVIGGVLPGERNVISGNLGAGVEISHSTVTHNNQIIGNYIGTDVSGSRGFTYTYNDQQGVNIEDGVRNNIVADNVIGNNRGDGVEILGFYTTANVVQNNRIGVGVDGSPVPNKGRAMYIHYQATRSMIGPNNIIANNAGGILISSAENDWHTISRNQIFNNAGLGIDLGPTIGVDPNDAGDRDSGANQQLNYPVITSATTTEARGSACGGCTIEVFRADGDAGAYGSGRDYLGATTAASNGVWNMSLSGVAVGERLTSTATDADGNTSEFGLNVAAVAGDTPTPTPTPTVTTTPTLTPTPTATPVVATHVQDQFSRTIVDGWGSAPIGGAYTLSGPPANFDVNGANGTIVSPAAGNSRAAMLSSVSAQDANVVYRVKTDKAATGSGQYTYFALRSSANGEYRIQLRFAADGTVYLGATRVDASGEKLLSSAVVVPNLTHTPNGYVRIRAQISGTNPTTIQVRAWENGQTEPTVWHLTRTDTTPVLQTAGAVGLRTYLSSSTTNAPVVVTFDEIQVSAR